VAVGLREIDGPAGRRKELGIENLTFQRKAMEKKSGREKRKKICRI
jgi:hypothetical protein